MSAAPESQEPILPIDIRFRDEVFFPWEEACHGSEHPWNATPKLRAGWKQLISSKDRLDREIGFLALSRCTSLKADEEETLLSFWEEKKDFEHISPAAALRLLLTGGSPGEYLFKMYFADLAPEGVSTNPIAKTLLGMLSRHPRLTNLAEQLSTVTKMYCFGFAWGLNPSIGEEPLIKLAEESNPWFRAAAFANPALPFDKAIRMASSQNDLDFVSLCLRPDLTPGQWEEINASYFPDESFMFIMLDHPAAQGKASPKVDWANPSLEAINHFNHQTYLGALWRWWNPLLTMPWLSDQLSEIHEPGVLLSFLLFGAPREIFVDSPALDNGLVRNYLKQHPGVMMENYYAKATKENPSGEEKGDFSGGKELPPRG